MTHEHRSPIKDGPLSQWCLYQFIVWAISFFAFFESPLPAIAYFATTLAGFLVLMFLNMAPNPFWYFLLNFLSSIVIFHYKEEIRERLKRR